MGMKEKKDEEDVLMKEKGNKKLESFEIQFVDVLIGVVDVEKMPNNQSLSKAFTSYSCGYGMFGGNGKILKGSEWIRVCKPLQHEESVTVCIEWMQQSEFNKLYATEKEIKNNQKSDDEFVVALTFHKNDNIADEMPKGAAFCLPS